MAIWKMRSSGLEQKGEIIDKESELKELPYEEGSLLANDDVKMSEVYSAVLSVDVSVTFTFKVVLQNTIWSFPIKICICRLSP